MAKIHCAQAGGPGPYSLVTRDVDLFSVPTQFLLAQFHFSTVSAGTATFLKAAGSGAPLLRFITH